MRTNIDLDNLLQFNNTFYIGNSFYTFLLNHQYSFIKGHLASTPRIFQHPSYNVGVIQSAAYLIREIYSGHIYIGSSGNIYKRIIKHKAGILKQQHDNSNFNKLLKQTNIQNFDLIIFFTENREDAYEVEQYFIDKYKNHTLLLNVGIDVRCAMNGLPLSEEHKRKISQSNIGRLTSEKTKQKLSLFHKTDIHAKTLMQEIHNRKKQPISVYGIKYKSLSEAGKYSGYSESLLRRALNRNDDSIFYMTDKINPLKGRSLSDEQKQHLSDYRKNNVDCKAQLERIRHLVKKKIILNGVEYDSIQESSRQTKIPIPTLTDQIKKINKSTLSGPYVINYVKPELRKVSVDGVIYNSVKEASQLLSVSISTLKARIYSDNIKNVFYI